MLRITRRYVSLGKHHKTEKPIELTTFDSARRRCSQEDGSLDPETLACSIMRLKNSTSPTEGRDYCRQLYEEVKTVRFGGSEMEADLYFFNLLGTSDLSKYFFGHVERDLGSKWETWYKGTFPRLVTQYQRPGVHRSFLGAKAVFKTCVYLLVSSTAGLLEKCTG